MEKAPDSDSILRTDASPFSSSAGDQSPLGLISPNIGGKYNMKHKRRGKALIFNHKFFDNAPDLTRAGTDKDRDALKEILGKQLGFEVEVYEDLCKLKVYQTIVKASLEDHTDADCFFVAVLTHGYADGSLRASDNLTYCLEDYMWSHFSGDKCPSLAGKPKLFLIQACRGLQRDLAVPVPNSELVIDSSPSGFTIPSHSDFLIAYSTIPGYAAWRNTVRGTWFIQAFCEVMKANWKSRDYVSILTRVNWKVSMEFGVKEFKQSACFLSNLTREIYFNTE